MFTKQSRSLACGASAAAIMTVSYDGEPMRSKAAATTETREGVRERILSAALAILRESGIQGLSQVQVARRADVRQSHVTYYFPKRHDLTEAVTVRFIDNLVSALQEVAARSHSRKRDALLGRAEEAIADPDHMRMFTGVIVEADTDPELRSVLVRETLRLQSALAHLLGDDAQEQAASILTSLWGRGLYAFVVEMGSGR
jgi:AcrR family transcriptional regulator